MRRISNTQLASEQRGHGFGITDTVVPLNEADRRAAFFLGMVVPLISAYGHAVVTGKSFIPAGRNKPFSTAAEKGFKVNRGSFLLLFVCKMYVG